MRNILRFSLVAMTLAFVFSAVAVTENKAQAANEILNRMDEYNKRLDSLEANVKMEKYNAQLDESDISTGAVKYLPKSCKVCKGKMYVRIDWTKPVEEQMSVIGDNYRLYRPRLNQVYEGKTSSAKNNAKVGGALNFMGMSKAELKNNYHLKYLGQENAGGVDTIHLELTPKTASNYKVAHLWVNGNGLPIMAKVVEKNNDSTTIFLSGVKTNVKINGSDFIINYPKSIKPIKG
jgi:outer membrane lipoprotein-sorting protein